MLDEVHYWGGNRGAVRQRRPEARLPGAYCSRHGLRRRFGVELMRETLGSGALPVGLVCREESPLQQNIMETSTCNA